MKKTQSIARKSKTNSGILYLYEKLVRSHPLFYFIIRSLIRFTNLFEEDANGVAFLNLNKKVNIIDVGASDGIAIKFFNRKLKINNIICFEPNPFYQKILRKLKIKNLKIKPFGIGNSNKYEKIFFPRYKFFFKNLDLFSYTFYNKQSLLDQINFDFKFKENISIVEKKIYLKKVRNINMKVDLIKIDVNGYELPVIKGLAEVIKRDKPALIVESSEDIKLIDIYLKKFGFSKYSFSNKKKKFIKIKHNCSLKKILESLNIYFLQKKHLN